MVLLNRMDTGVQILPMHTEYIAQNLAGYGSNNKPARIVKRIIHAMFKCPGNVPVMVATLVNTR